MKRKKGSRANTTLSHFRAAKMKQIRLSYIRKLIIAIAICNTKIAIFKQTLIST